jgi:pantoate kinase
VHYDPAKDIDLRQAGATGGGYMLSKGVVSRATLTPDGPGTVAVVVDGNARYRAATTKKAIQLLLGDHPLEMGRLLVEQWMQVPVGGGFGASAAAAVSAVYAVAAVIGCSEPKSALAAYAHRAEILQQTGLGTVSVIYDGTGAGAIFEPGEPGVARFLNVEVPGDLRIVTAFIAPFVKKDALSSRKLSDKINKLGAASLRRFMSSPTIDSLAEEGERFSRSLGLETPEVKRLLSAAKEAGAAYASQNMIGFAVHALASLDDSGRVAARMSELGPRVRVDRFSVSSARAGVIPPSRRRQVPS